MRYKTFKLICIFLLTNSFVFAQSAKKQLAIVNAAKLVSGKFYDEIPYINKLGYLTIKIKFDSAEYEYIFDTGGYNTVSSEIMDKEKLPTLMEVEVGSSNQLKSKIKLSKVPKLQIGKAVFGDVGVFNFDFTASPVINCYTNGGLIGKSVIGEAVWQIDSRNTMIRISDDIQNMPNVDKGYRVNVRLDKVLNPFVKLQINDKEEEFLLDLGYGGFISLTEKTASAYNFHDKILIEGEGDISANGVVKESSFLVPLKKLAIANIEFNKQVAFFSKSNNLNLLGSELTKYFIVTLDFKNKNLILTPYTNTETEYETFGFSTNILNNKVYVNKLFNNLPAQKTGLQLNDLIVSINDKPIEELKICDAYFLINNSLKSEKEIRLKIKRNDDYKEFQITKQKPF